MALIERGAVARAASIAGVVLVWEIVARLTSDSVLPGPWPVLTDMVAQVASGELPRQLGITLLRVAASFSLAMLIGVVLGILMGTYESIDLALDAPLVLALNIPALVTIVLCFIWFGLTEVATITAVVINKVPTVIVCIREGARAVDKGLIQVGHAFQLGAFRSFRRIYLPQLYPYLVAASRSGLALIWKIVLVVELLGRSDGVGFKIGTYFQYFDIHGILVYTLAFAGVILLLEAAVMRPLERSCSRWR